MPYAILLPVAARAAPEEMLTIDLPRCAASRAPRGDNRDRCHHHHVEHAPPRFIGGTNHVGVLGQRRHRVVVQHVHPAEPLERRLDQRGDVALLPHVGRPHRNGRAEVGRVRLQPLDVEVAGHHASSLGDHQPYRRRTDAARTTGDHGDFAVETRAIPPRSHTP